MTYVPPEADRPSRKDVLAEMQRRFRGFGVGAVAVAGLLDGINPCAFTTIIFLLSMLTFLGKSRRLRRAPRPGRPEGIRLVCEKLRKWLDRPERPSVI